MFKNGLVSISFRQHSIDEIVLAAAQAQLEAIEWGGDVHVPPGNEAAARKAAALTTRAGLSTAAYGSYYRLGNPSNTEDDFKRIIETACLLDAPVIRIWGGSCGSGAIDEETLHVWAEEAQRIAALAQKAGKLLSLECHPDTLTDDYRAALRFLAKADAPALTMYWQPNPFKSLSYNCEAALALHAVTTNLHVFHWDAHTRYPLAEGAVAWSRYLQAFRGDEMCHHLLLEFMHDDRLASLRETAEILFKSI